MRVSGFTICRDGIIAGYPVEASIRSLLPLVDELIVGVGQGSDGTWDVVNAIDDPKIHAFRSEWDLTPGRAGFVIAEQTNLALAQCTGDWAVYLQVDEVLHEVDIARIRRRMEEHADQPTEGLSFRYWHFYGSYATVQDNWCSWYKREVRAVKTLKGVVSVGDGCGFAVMRHGISRRLIRADAGAFVYHYGWALPPAIMKAKRRQVRQLYEAGPIQEADDPYPAVGNLARFSGSHPSVMRENIERYSWEFESHIEEQPPRWRRQMSLLWACPGGALRVAASRVLLRWNTHIRKPKLR